MSIASQITRISTAKEAIRTKLNAKGCSISSSAKIDEYADYVADIAGTYITPDPLTFEALANGNITWKTNNANWVKDIQYSKDNGETWTTLTPNTSGANIAVASGDKVLIRGNNDTYSNETRSYYCYFTGSINYYVYGNITDLLGEGYKDGIKPCCFFSLFASNTHLYSHSTKDLVLPSKFMGVDCYRRMFYGCTKITRAPRIEATVLNYTCFYEMFRGCTALTDPPTLSVSMVPSNGYGYMFYGCTSLVTPPSLPASRVDTYGYYYMFYGCTALTSAPALPATTVGSYCYSYMFSGCTSLVTAPATLPATTLNTYCYSYMFNGCTALATAPTLPATSLQSYCYQYMFKGCTSLTTCPALPATTLQNYCYRQMFYGCTHITESPILRAATLASYCYNNMFNGCTRLATITCLATSITASNALTDWVKSVASSGTFYKDSSVSTWPSGTSGIPANWTTTNYSES